MQNEMQNTDAWHEARKGKVSASRAGSILGVDKRRSRDELMRQMVREYHGAEAEISPFVQGLFDHGKKTEAVAIAAIQVERGEFIEDAGFIHHPKIAWLGCSPDGLIGEDEGVEVKCPTTHRKDIMDILGDEGYRCQCLLSLIVTGRSEWHFYAYRDGHLVSTTFTKKEAEIWFSEVYDELEKFYESLMAICSSEELSAEYLGSPIVEREDDSWCDLTVNYREAVKDVERAKARLELCKSKLIESAEGKKTRGAGVTVYPVKARKKTDYKKACTDANLNLSDYQTIGEVTWSVRLQNRDI